MNRLGRTGFCCCRQIVVVLIRAASFQTGNHRFGASPSNAQSGFWIASWRHRCRKFGARCHFPWQSGTLSAIHRWIELELLLLGSDLLLEIVGEGLRNNCHRDEWTRRPNQVDHMLMRRTSNVFSVYLKNGKGTTLECVRVWVWERNEILTAMRKSPGRSPAISATPPGSTSSKYCKPGQRSDGFNCISGDAAFAPRNTKPKPLLARWRTTFRDSMIPLKTEKENEKWISKMSLSFPPFSLHVNVEIYIFFWRGAVALLYCWCGGGGCCDDSCCSCCWLPPLPLFTADDDENVCWSIGCMLMTVFLW